MPHTEALDKLATGMSILIREGSAAKNDQALHRVIGSHRDHCMRCSDNKHPHDLGRGHLNDLVRQSVTLGYDVMQVLQVACVNPVRHYGLDMGLLQRGDAADLIVVNNLTDFQILQTYCKGQWVAQAGRALLPSSPIQPLSYWVTVPKSVDDFRVDAAGTQVPVIEVPDGQLWTGMAQTPAPIQAGELRSQPDRDLLKLTVVHRYANVPPAVALVRNFNLKRGAIAASVAHNSHNIVAVGTTDAELCRAVNAVIQAQGGIAVVEGHTIDVLPLPVTGLMSAADGYWIAARDAQLDAAAKQLGSPLAAPFMILSFMALLVIPELKLSDRGLFDSQTGKFVSLWVD